MKKFTIKANGESMGTFEGTDAEAAVETYARDAGYGSYTELCEETGDDRDTLDVVEFKTTRHIMVTARPENDETPMPNGDGIIDQSDHYVFGPEALGALAQKLFDTTEADIEAGKYGDGAFRLMVIDYTVEDQGLDLYDEIIKVG